MPVTVTVITTKPPGEKFFSEFDVANCENIIANVDAFVESTPGFISHTRDRTDENTITEVYVWDTMRNYENAWADRFDRADHEIRVTYNRSHKIASTITEVSMDNTQ